MRARRIVVKVGSSSLTDGEGRLSTQKIEHLVSSIVRLQKQEGCQVTVVSSGAVAAGMGRLGWKRATMTIPEKQAAAAVGQGLLIDIYQRLFAVYNIPIAQVLLTRADFHDRKRFIHVRNTMETLLRNRILPIVNENDTVSVEEIQFGDNDTLGSLVSLLVEADLLVLLTDIDGMYTSNPKTDPQAKRIPDVWQITDVLEGAAGDEGSPVGTGGMRTKVAAAKIAMQSGTDVVIAKSGTKDVLERIVRGEAIGTRFHARRNPLSKKRSWMTHGSRAEGQIRIDDGAKSALIDHAGSLLMPGIVEVQGEFPVGAVIELIGTDGLQIGRGIINFSAWDLRLLLERKRHGEKMPNLQEVVHRNQMAVLRERTNP